MSLTPPVPHFCAIRHRKKDAPGPGPHLPAVVQSKGHPTAASSKVLVPEGCFWLQC